MIKICMMDNGIEFWAIRAVQAGVKEVLQSLGRGSAINYGLWRTSQWVLNKTLQAYQSVDWYVAQASSRRGLGGRKQVNAHDILTALWNEPWREGNPHLDIFVVKEDIYSERCNWCFGLGMEEVGCVISTARWEREGRLAGACVTSMTIHELAHALGLLPDHRVRNVEKSLGKHCTNPGCVMRQRLTQEGLVEMTKERIQRGPGRAFCSECLTDLRNISA